MTRYFCIGCLKGRADKQRWVLLNKTGPVHLSLKLFKHSHNFYQQPFVTVAPLCTCVQKKFHFALHFQNPEPSRAKTSLGRHPLQFKILFDSSTSSAAAQVPLGQLQASHTDTAGQLKIARQQQVGSTQLPSPRCSSPPLTAPGLHEAVERAF